MKTLQIEDKEARKLYPVASPEMKTILLATYGKNFFEGSIMDRVKSYDDACDIEEPSKEDKIYPTDAPYIVYFKKLIHIHKVLNEGWKADYSDNNQKKWFSWFRYSSSGFAFVDSFYSYADASAGCGARLALKSEELEKYSAIQFADLHNGLLNY